MTTTCQWHFFSGIRVGGIIMNATKRILIVDDEAGNRVLLEALMTSMGYQCLLASNGFEALDCLGPGIDLVLLDIMMPGLDGCEVARRIRCGAWCQGIPIIMVSGLNSAEDRLRAEQAGATMFVSKPINGAELRLNVSSLLSVPSQMRVRVNK